MFVRADDVFRHALVYLQPSFLALFLGDRWREIEKRAGGFGVYLQPYAISERVVRVQCIPFCAVLRLYYGNMIIFVDVMVDIHSSLVGVFMLKRHQPQIGTDAHKSYAYEEHKTDGEDI